MDQHARDILEYPLALRQIAEYARGELVQTHIKSIMPATDRMIILKRQNVYRQVEIALRAENSNYPDISPEDLSSILKKLRPVGTVLSNADLYRCLTALQAAAVLGKFLNRDACQNLSELIGMNNELEMMPGLRRQLDSTYDDDQMIADGASQELTRIRRQIRTHKKDINERLEQMLTDNRLAAAFQDKFVTLRNRRYVLPVRREARAKIPGVVHDHSDSGRTLFMEPAAILPLGNNLADLYADEEDECRRIRAALSNMVRSQHSAFENNQVVLVRFCAGVAVCRWAAACDCAFPEFGPTLKLRQARHPLLARQLADQGMSDQLVPLDLSLAENCRGLVITGSNSGGKTVAIKTIGLLTLLAQAGFPLPIAEESRLFMVDNVFADVGDEQSLTENLSTFTGHLRRIAEIFEKLDAAESGRSLVILDELGTGTDPLEGGALACAILEHLAMVEGLTFATTHLGVVKAFVHEHTTLENASVRFNMDTLEPEYGLDLGLPGASHALNIAARIGVPVSVLRNAEKYLDRDQLKLERLLGNLEENQRRIEDREKQTRQLLLETDRDRQTVAAERDSFRRERHRLLHDAYEEARRIVDETRRRGEQLIAELSSTEKLRNDTARLMKEKMQTEQNEVQVRLEEHKAKPEKPLNPASLSPGDELWIEKLQSNAILKSLSAGTGKAKVMIGQIEFEVNADEIGLPEPASRKTSQNQPAIRESRPKLKKKVSQELNLIGYRVAEALPRLERFLDETALGALPEVRIVHGYGTGTLRKAIHEHLRESPLVESFKLGDPERTPGGNGVTIVVMRD